MDDEFHEAIVENPDDLTSRLVYADWLLEQTETVRHERGEFIQLQIALSTQRIAADVRGRLLLRQRELLEKYRGAWTARFRGLVRSWEYHHGFAERVTLDVEQLCMGFQELIFRTPVVRVRLHGLTAQNVDEIRSFQPLEHVRELDLQREGIQPEVLWTLLQSPHLTRLRGLHLARNRLGWDAVHALLQSNLLDKLEYLNLGACDLSLEAVQELLRVLASWPRVPLRKLVLRGAPRLPPTRLPHLPSTWPVQLRQSIYNQVAQDPVDTYERVNGSLQNLVNELPEELRRWVGRMQSTLYRNLHKGLRELSLPAAVQGAFAAACERRMLWRASRSGKMLQVVPLHPATSSEDLAELVQQLLELADAEEREGCALMTCLLDLYQRHELGELAEDGKTRTLIP